MTHILFRMTHHVYKIWSEKGDMVYYGSTSCRRGAVQRYHIHVSEYKSGRIKCLSKLLFETYGVENCIFTLLEECGTSEIKLRRERWYIENNICVNDKRPAPTKEEIKSDKKEYTLAHKDDKQKYDAEYRKKNTDKRHEKIICDCGGSYVKRHKTTHDKTKLHLEYIKK